LKALHLYRSYENCRRPGVAILDMQMSKVPIISGYVPHSRHITGFVTIVPRRMSLVEQELLTPLEHPSSSAIGGGSKSLSFFFWPLYCLSFDLRLLFTPLVSSVQT